MPSAGCGDGTGIRYAVAPVQGNITARSLGHTVWDPREGNVSSLDPKRFVLEAVFGAVKYIDPQLYDSPLIPSGPHQAVSRTVSRQSHNLASLLRHSTSCLLLVKNTRFLSGFPPRVSCGRCRDPGGSPRFPAAGI